MKRENCLAPIVNEDGLCQLQHVVTTFTTKTYKILNNQYALPRRESIILWRTFAADLDIC
jgi:hypothetical protein